MLKGKDYRVKDNMFPLVTAFIERVTGYMNEFKPQTIIRRI